MIGAIDALPWLYSAVRLPAASYTAWWTRPNPWPASWAIDSATARRSLAKVSLNVHAVLFAELANAPGNATPLRPVIPVHAPSPPITDFIVTRSARLPGSTVVTLRLNGEYFSATRAQISRMALISPVLNASALPSVSYAGVAGTLYVPQVWAGEPWKSGYSLAVAAERLLSAGTPGMLTATAMSRRGSSGVRSKWLCRASRFGLMASTLPPRWRVRSAPRRARNERPGTKRTRTAEGITTHRGRRIVPKI